MSNSNTNLAADEAVSRAVGQAVDGDPPHPGLQDFLKGVGEP